jgi:hypothetical protein
VLVSRARGRQSARTALEARKHWPAGGNFDVSDQAGQSTLIVLVAQKKDDAAAREFSSPS